MNALICLLVLLSASASPPDDFQAARQKQWLLLQYKSDLGLTPSQLSEEKENLDALSPAQVAALVNDYRREQKEARLREGLAYRDYLRNDLSSQQYVDLGPPYLPNDYSYYSSYYSYSPYLYYWPTFYVPYRTYSYGSGYIYKSVPNYGHARTYSYARSSGRAYYQPHTSASRSSFYSRPTPSHRRR